MMAGAGRGHRLFALGALGALAACAPALVPTPPEPDPGSVTTAARVAAAASAPPAATGVPVAASSAPIALRAAVSDTPRAWAVAYVGKLSGNALDLRRFWRATRLELEALLGSYDRACGAGELIACTAAATLAEQLGQGFAARARAYVDACKAGELVACARLSLTWPCHHMNDDVRRTQRASCEGLDEADRYLGQEGLPTRAKHHILAGARIAGTRACDGGVAAGCAAVAASYEVRPTDLPRAVELYAKGCELGHFGACRRAFHVGREARKSAPQLGPRADAAAKRQLALALAACDADDPTACATAAAQLAEGSGVPRDVTRARALYQRACDGKVDHACDDLARLSKER